MIFTALPLNDAFLIEPQRLEDERGFFARTFSTDEFAAHGLAGAIAQCSVSYNRRRGTVRGLHFQVPPHDEIKHVRCTRGAAFDVIVDLRPESPTYKRWASVELSADNRAIVYIPGGFAHGFQTLVDDTELFYQISTPHVPEAARGIRWDDPDLAIAWPVADQRVISARDLALPTLADLGARFTG
jgi:dTDP-4-dehydrorhamnose 3,5-epimerase